MTQKPDEELISIECFGVMEECDKCNEFHQIVVFVNDENCYCKQCFDNLYECVRAHRKQQMMDS